MLLLLTLSIGTLTACGVWLLLRARSFDAILGLTLLSYAVNLFLFATGRPRVDAEPILTPGVAATLANTTDPLPQALVLTAIVIAFAMLLAIALRARAETGSDHVDSKEPQ